MQYNGRDIAKTRSLQNNSKDKAVEVIRQEDNTKERYGVLAKEKVRGYVNMDTFCNNKVFWGKHV